MDFINLLGSKLSELTGQYEYGCVALINLAIKDAGKDPAKISYPDMKAVIQVHLLKRLERIKQKDPNKIVAQMLQVLSDKQSLFVVTAR